VAGQPAAVWRAVELRGEPCRECGASVVGGASVVTIVGSTVTEPTPYSRVVEVQYAELASCVENSSIEACIAASFAKKIGWIFGGGQDRATERDQRGCRAVRRFGTWHSSIGLDHRFRRDVVSARRTTPAPQPKQQREVLHPTSASRPCRPSMLT